MILKKIQLHNFQKHADVSVDFTTGVNAIVGPTDLGKSAVFRAILWATTNAYSPSIVRRKIEKGLSEETWVKLTIEESGADHVIERYVSTTKNYYKLNEQLFKSFGRGGVPEPIKKLLKISEINIQEQWDSPFLIADSSGDVARLFNDLIGLSEMDSLLESVNSDVKEAQSSVDTLTSSIESLTKASEQNEDIDTKISLFDSVTQDITDLSKKNVLLSSLSSIISNHREPSNIKVDQSSLNELEEAFSSWSSNRDLLTRINQYVEVTNKEKEIPSLDTLEDLLNKCKQVFVDVDTISNLIEGLVSLREHNKELQVEIDTYNLELDTFDVCPACGATKHE